MQAMTYPLRLDGGLGRFHRLSEAEEVAQSVRMILMTRKGERPLRPAFGADVNHFAFESMDNTTQNLIRRAVVESLHEWEPRITDIQVSFVRKPEDGKLFVLVDYILISTGQRAQADVPFTEK